MSILAAVMPGPRQAESPRRSPRMMVPAARIFVAAILFRLFSAFVAFLANATFPPLQDQRFTVLGSPNAFWDAFARYDAGWYHAIASQGYIYGEGGRNNLAFFPLYPMLMRGGGTLLGSRQEDFYFAGVVISWLAFAGALVMLYRLARLDLDERAAYRAVMYAAIFPFAYFFGMVYSESLFFFGLVTAVYALRTRQWALAAVAGAAMTATRVTGVIALPGLAWIAWRATEDTENTRATEDTENTETTKRRRREVVKAALAIAGCAAGIGAYSAYIYTLSGSPFAWYDAITYWNYHPGQNPIAMPFAVMRAVMTRPLQYIGTEQMAPYDTLNTLAALGALGLTPLVWRRFGTGYAFIVLGGMLLPLSSGQLEGLGRYASVQFPLALALASLGGEMRHTTLFTVFAMLYAICLALFVTVHPLF